MVIAIGDLADYTTAAPEIAERDHKPRTRCRPLEEIAFAPGDGLDGLIHRALSRKAVAPRRIRRRTTRLSGIDENQGGLIRGDRRSVITPRGRSIGVGAPQSATLGRQRGTVRNVQRVLLLRTPRRGPSPDRLPVAGVSRCAGLKSPSNLPERTS